MKKLSTEDILWKAIKDIEEGNVSFIKDDPINGYLKGRNKFLSKVNVSAQSAKYTNNNKPISRPTIDTYSNIVDYINNSKGVDNKNQKIIEENKFLKNQNSKLLAEIKELKKINNILAEKKYLEGL